jgi:hypothetical protein
VKQVGRKRRVLGWALAMIGLVMAGVWFASGLYCPRFTVGDYKVAVHRGLFHVLVLPPYTPPTTAVASPWTLHQKIEDERRKRVDQSWAKIARGDEQPGWDWKLRKQPADLIRNLAFIAPESVLLTMPAWPIPLVFWFAAALLLSSGVIARRRRWVGMCGACGYSLAGLAVGAPCPECGKGVGTT